MTFSWLRNGLAPVSVRLEIVVPDGHSGNLIVRRVARLGISGVLLLCRVTSRNCLEVVKWLESHQRESLRRNAVVMGLTVPNRYKQWTRARNFDALMTVTDGR